MGQVSMNATRGNMISLLGLFGEKKSYLNKLSDKELQQLGIEIGAWKSIETDEQKTLGDLK